MATAKKKKPDFEKEITERFVHAIDLVAAEKRLKIGDVAKAVGTLGPSISRMRSRPLQHHPSSEMMALLCSSYNVSAAWLLLGEGDKFNIPKSIEDRLHNIETLLKMR